MRYGKHYQHAYVYYGCEEYRFGKTTTLNGSSMKMLEPMKRRRESAQKEEIKYHTQWRERGKMPRERYTESERKKLME